VRTSLGTEGCFRPVQGTTPANVGGTGSGAIAEGNSRSTASAGATGNRRRQRRNGSMHLGAKRFRRQPFDGVARFGKCVQHIAREPPGHAAIARAWTHLNPLAAGSGVAQRAAQCDGQDTVPAAARRDADAIRSWATADFTAPSEGVAHGDCPPVGARRRRRG